MRAIYFPCKNQALGSRVELSGESYGRLTRTVRIKPGETLLLLDGEGGVLKGEVLLCASKSIQIKICEICHKKTTHRNALYLCLPKREALYLCLKQAVELGIMDITIVLSEYSQRYPLNHHRIKNIFISAIEQSNNPFLPVLRGPLKFNEFVESIKKKNMTIFSSRPQNQSYSLPQENISFFGPKEEDICFFIGSEGGLTIQEEERLAGHHIIHLPTHLLRTPTALSSAYGYLLGLQKNC